MLLRAHYEIHHPALAFCYVGSAIFGGPIQSLAGRFQVVSCATYSRGDRSIFWSKTEEAFLKCVSKHFPMSPMSALDKSSEETVGATFWLITKVGKIGQERTAASKEPGFGSTNA